MIASLDMPPTSPGYTLSLRSLYQLLGRIPGLRLLGRWGGRPAGFVLLATLLALLQRHPGLLEPLRLGLFDRFQRARPARQASADTSPVMIVAVDERSLQRHGQWPWPRSVMARLFAALGREPLAVGVDMFFPEKDRLSPERLLELYPTLDADARTALRKLPSGDQALAQSLQSLPVVLGNAGVDVAIPVKQPAFLQHNLRTVGSGSGDALSLLPHYNSAVRSLDEFGRAAVGHAALNAPPEHDGIIRRIPAVVRIGDAILPTLSLEMIRVAAGAPGFQIERAPQGITAVEVAGFRVPTDPDGRIWVPLTPHAEWRYVSAADVLDGKLPESAFAGRFILVGLRSSGLGDLVSTPLEHDLPGVEVHAQLLDAILEKCSLQRPPWAVQLERLALLVAGLLVVALVPRLRLRYSALGAVAILIALGASGWFQYKRSLLLLDPSPPILGTSVLLLVMLGFKGAAIDQARRLLQAEVAEKERQRQQALEERLAEAERNAALGRTFEQFVPKEFIERLDVRDITQLTLGQGVEKQLTVLFSDIRSFTSLVERMSPQENFAFINEYLGYMEPPIHQVHGFIDKYIGDAVMALFDARPGQPGTSGAAEGVAAAVGMQRELARYNDARRARGEKPIAIGIGLHTGRLMLGTIGGQQRLNASVIGDAVNLASRIEGMTKQYDAPVLITEDTVTHLPPDHGFQLRLVDRVRAKGKTEAVRIFEVLDGDSDARRAAKRPLIAPFAAVWDDYQQGRFAAALDALEAMAAQAPDDRLVSLYLHRCRALIAHPPSQGWDGIYTMTEK